MASRYVKLTDSEKSVLTEAMAQDFGESRISQGAYIRYLAEQRQVRNE